MAWANRAAIFLYLLGGAITTGHAAIQSPPDTVSESKGQSLNRTLVSEAYSDGDFDRVVSQLEADLAAPQGLSHSDSVFAYKYLSVVYCAYSKTKEKGKYYMFRLLELDPKAELTELFVSDEVDLAFAKVRREFAVTQAKQAKASSPSSPTTPALSDGKGVEPESTDTKGKQLISNSSSPSRQPDREKHIGYWVAGGALAAGVVTVATYFILNSGGDEGPIYVVDINDANR